MSKPKPWRLQDHDITEINDYLFISNFSTSLNIPHILKLRASIIISLSLNIKTPDEQALYIDNKIESHHFPIDDSLSQTIGEALEKANDVITQAITDKKRVVLHCDMGMSRAPTIAIGHFIMYHRMNLYDSMAFVLSRRKGARPNINFKNQLIILERRQKEKQNIPIEFDRNFHETRQDIIKLFDTHFQSSAMYNAENLSKFITDMRNRILKQNTCYDDPIETDTCYADITNDCGCKICVKKQDASDPESIDNHVSV